MEEYIFIQVFTRVGCTRYVQMTGERHTYTDDWAWGVLYLYR